MSNEYVDWIEQSIADKHINYYEYSEFKHIQPIGKDSVCVEWKHTSCIFVLKSFGNEKTILKEVVNEV